MIACIKSHFPMFQAQYSNSRGFSNEFDARKDFLRHEKKEK